MAPTVGIWGILWMMGWDSRSRETRLCSANFRPSISSSFSLLFKLPKNHLPRCPHPSVPTTGPDDTFFLKLSLKFPFISPVAASGTLNFLVRFYVLIFRIAGLGGIDKSVFPRVLLLLLFFIRYVYEIFLFFIR
ncbi:hypothetical protein Csa_019062 [Cucumis sativus]|uniref:Uncharacterized protein n=1 Tax=Cucumis sativus TaxID=3659 RepID=A0A0A0KGP8_CUCSA|nr:hypothetical protein Csa_019062 [Cucumis sativus]